MFIHSMNTDSHYNNHTSNYVIPRHMLLKKDHRPDQNQNIQNAFSKISRRKRYHLQKHLPHNCKNTEASHCQYIKNDKFFERVSYKPAYLINTELKL